MELAKQMILTSVNAPKSKTESDPEKKKLKWESRKSEFVAEIREILLKEKRLVQTPVDSSEEEKELPQKRPKKEKKSKSAPAVQKEAKKLSSHSFGKEHTKVSRKPVKRAVYDESEQSSRESRGHDRSWPLQIQREIWARRIKRKRAGACCACLETLVTRFVIFYYYQVYVKYS